MKFEGDRSNPLEVMISQTQVFGKAISPDLVTILKQIVQFEIIVRPACANNGTSVGDLKALKSKHNENTEG